MHNDFLGFDVSASSFDLNFNADATHMVEALERKTEERLQCYTWRHHVAERENRRIRRDRHCDLEITRQHRQGFQLSTIANRRH